MEFPKAPGSDASAETEATSDRGSKTGHQQEAEESSTKRLSAERVETTAKNETTEAALSFSRHWFNTVLYGTASLVLTTKRD